MATTNFSYENRCIVVTNDDFNILNVPDLKKGHYGDDRNYPSRELLASDDFTFWDILLTNGYYDHACLDYVESGTTVEDYIGDVWNMETQKEFFDACMKEFRLTRYRLRKLCGKIGDQRIDDYLEQAAENVTGWLAEKERPKVEACLDGLKQYYGYEELYCVGVFSNGEAVYELKAS